MRAVEGAEAEADRAETALQVRLVVLVVLDYLLAGLEQVAVLELVAEAEQVEQVVVVE
jgi:hypothetical protein